MSTPPFVWCRPNHQVPMYIRFLGSKNTPRVVHLSSKTPTTTSLSTTYHTGFCASAFTWRSLLELWSRLDAVHLLALRLHSTVADPQLDISFFLSGIRQRHSSIEILFIMVTGVTARRFQVVLHRHLCLGAGRQDIRDWSWTVKRQNMFQTDRVGRTISWLSAWARRIASHSRLCSFSCG